MWRFHKGVDFGAIGASRWTVSGSNIYRPTSVGIGAAPPSGQSASYDALYVDSGMVLGPSYKRVTNAYYNGSDWKFSATGRADALNTGGGQLIYYNSASGTAGNTVTFVERLKVKTTGELVCNPSYINVRQYGALGDGSTDDTTAISNALTDAAANGLRRVYFPQGTYRTTSALTTTGNLMLFGDGPGLSIIKVDHAGKGISHTGIIGTYETEKLEILHLGFRSNNASATEAIYAIYRNTSTGTWSQSPCVLIHDVSIGAVGSTTAFACGIKLYNASHSTISQVQVYGLESGTTPGSSYGIYLAGGDTTTAWVTATSYAVNDQVLNGGIAYWCNTAHTSGTFATDLAAGKWFAANLVDAKIRDCTINYVETAIQCWNIEGLHCQQNTLLSPRDGIVVDTTLTNGKVYVDITGNHIACARIGIWLREMTQWIVAQNLVYCIKSIPLSTTYTEALRIESGSLGSVSMLSLVTDNIAVCLEDSGTYATKYAYAVYGGSGSTESVTFKGNRSENFGTLIYLDSSTTGVVVEADNTASSGETWSDNGTANLMPFGTYTPTLTNTTNIAASTNYACQWSRTGKAVTVSGKFDADPTAAGACDMGMSIPIASNFTAANQLGGSGAIVAGGSATTEFLQITADATNDRAQIQWNATLTTNNGFTFIFHYLIW